MAVDHMFFLTGKVILALIGGLILGFLIGWWLRSRFLSIQTGTSKPLPIRTDADNSFISSNDTVPVQTLFSANLGSFEEPLTPSKALEALKESKRRREEKLNLDEGTSSI